VTEELYNKVVTIHSLHFRTRKILEQLSKPDPCIFRDDPELGKIFKDAWEARDSFCTLEATPPLRRWLTIPRCGIPTRWE